MKMQHTHPYVHLTNGRRLKRGDRRWLLVPIFVHAMSCQRETRIAVSAVPFRACPASQDSQAPQLQSEWFRTVGRRLGETAGPLVLLDERPLGMRPVAAGQDLGRLRIRVSGPLFGNWLSEYFWSEDRAGAEVVAYELVYGGTSASIYNGRLTKDQVKQLERCAVKVSQTCLSTLEDKGLAPSTIDGVESSFEYMSRHGALAIMRESPLQDVERRGLTQYNACMCEILSLPFARQGSAARVFCSPSN
jgi:hypothetical protein